jgi:glyoxylase-like metal-dependent hydrolase (beta-lactamase superfamily II)
MKQTIGGTLPTSEYFELQRLADGVYAALGMSNAGIVDLGDRTLILDTLDTPQAGQDLRAAAEQLTGRPAAYVVITHVHADHWCGNQAFAGQATIISTHTIRQVMPDAVEWLRHYQQNPDEMEAEIEANRERLETETDPQWRAFLEARILRWRWVLETLPSLEFHLPQQTFERELIFHGSGRRAELRTEGVGHSASDAYLVLPEDGIAFIGDLGFFQAQPFMAFAEPQAWVAQVEAMQQWDQEVFVPGHGPVGGKGDLVLQRDYIILLGDLVAEVVEQGGTVEEAQQLVLPAPFDRWPSPARLETNVQALYERLSGRDAD